MANVAVNVSGVTAPRGYRASGNSCITVEVPVNGHYVDEDYGSGWKCNRGYVAVTTACGAVKMPQNAHLDYSGNSWECDRPYRRERDRCTSPQ